MIQKVDLGDNRNLFTVSVILIAGVGGMALTFGKVTVTEVACALILGILTNVLVNIGKKKETPESISAEDAVPAAGVGQAEFVSEEGEAAPTASDTANEQADTDNVQ